tara:strand:- start:6274 stop:7845 length:1572 start_codon:yes stop_codon:yes gene_type:complete
MAETTTVQTTQRRPEYIEQREQLLLDQIFGTPTTADDGSVTYSGGLIDASKYPDLFTIPEYKQAALDPLEQAAYGMFDSPEERQAYVNRYQPYFLDASGKPRYLQEAGAGIASGLDTLRDASSYFPTAQNYISSGAGEIDAKGMYDTELGGAKLRADLGSQTYQPPVGSYEAAISDINRGQGDFGARSAYDRRIDPSLQTAQQGLGKFDPSESVSSFMDPYKQQVIDEAMKQINKQGEQAINKMNASAVGAGAFGGSRTGVQAAETAKNILDSKSSTIANLLSGGYSQSLKGAMAADEASRKRALDAAGLTGRLGAEGARLEGSAFEGARKRDLQAGQLGAGITGAENKAQQAAFESGQKRLQQAADQYRSMGLSSAQAQARAKEDEYKRNLEAGRLYGGLGQTLGAIGSAQGEMGGRYGNLAARGADIGTAYSRLAPADIAMMGSLGMGRRDYRQQGIDTARQEGMRNTQQALMPYNYAYSALSGTPSASMYNTYNTSPVAQTNPFLAGIGAYSTLRGLNQA